MSWPQRLIRLGKIHNSMRAPSIPELHPEEHSPRGKGVRDALTQTRAHTHTFLTRRKNNHKIKQNKAGDARGRTIGYTKHTQETTTFRGKLAIESRWPIGERSVCFFLPRRMSRERITGERMSKERKRDNWLRSLSVFLFAQRREKAPTNTDTAEFARDQIRMTQSVCARGGND